MRKRAEQHCELPHGKHAQKSDDCGNENLSLALSRGVHRTSMMHVDQTHFGHLNHELPHLNTSTRPNAQEVAPALAASAAKGDAR